AMRLRQHGGRQSGERGGRARQASPGGRRRPGDLALRHIRTVRGLTLRARFARRAAAARPPQGEGSAQIPPQPEERAKHPSRRSGGPARCILPVLAPVTQRYVLHILLLWLAGNALRLPILAVPPVIPAIHHDLNLSATGVGILGGLPVVVFAVAAVPG